MSQLDLIVLANTKNQQYADLTRDCLQAYLSSGSDYIKKIILMETNAEWDTACWNDISTKIHCITPKIPFNYNRYLNKALELCQSPLICISNNDVFPQGNCIPNIIKAFERDLDLMSASPIDRTWHQNSYGEFPDENTVYEGWTTTKFVLGFNLYMRSQIYNKLGMYDERFDFYYQDNDYEMGLRAFGLKHGLVSNAHITHGKPNYVSDENSSEKVGLKLKEDRLKFAKKWNNTNNVIFKKYLKLGILKTNEPFRKYNQYVSISSDKKDIEHAHYLLEWDSEITDFLISAILHKIDMTDADKIIIDEKHAAIRNF